MIAIDWGTTSLRAFRLDVDGRVLETRRSALGVLAAGGQFENVLRSEIEGWDDALIVMSGMVGSRQGWREVPYIECPAGLDEIAAAMRQLDVPQLSERRIWLVPGLTVQSDDGTRDVMRGEETQICGLLEELGAGRHHVCLPGTHSKHAQICDGRIERFHTAMTGELFDLLCKHSILGSLMQPGSPHQPVAFALGVDDALQARDLLVQLFAVRTKGLFGALQATELSSYLSGLLIGHELNDLPSGIDLLHVVAADHLLTLYTQALVRRGRHARNHADHATARGIYALATHRRLLSIEKPHYRI
jgi:2-dehydro-3-deoxygalactonokinase